MDWFKKLLYFFICFLISTELLMRAGGFFAQFPGSQDEKKNFDPQAEHTIVVLGESTSAEYFSEGMNSAWPIQLRRKLRSLGYSLNVYNLSEPGITTPFLIQKLIKLLETQKVDAVITMMGTNDPVTVTHGMKFQSKIRSSFKVIQLFKWVYQELVNRGLRPQQTEKETLLDSRLDEWAKRVLDSKHQEVIDEIMTLEGCKRAFNFAELQSILFLDYKRYDRPSYETIFAREMIDACPDEDYIHFWFSEIFSTHYKDQELMDRAERLLQKYGTRVGRGVQEHFLSVATSGLRPDLLKVMKKVGFEFVEASGVEAGSSESFRSLLKLKQQHNFKLFVMQYPTIPLMELQRTLSLSDFKKAGVEFIENRENFQKAMSENGYDHVFHDRFRGSWGHTTQIGHELICESVRKALEENYFKEK